MGACQKARPRAKYKRGWFLRACAGVIRRLVCPEVGDFYSTLLGDASFWQPHAIGDTPCNACSFGRPMIVEWARRVRVRVCCPHGGGLLHRPGDRPYPPHHRADRAPAPHPRGWLRTNPAAG
jgi:hypothetical protein